MPSIGEFRFHFVRCCRFQSARAVACRRPGLPHQWINRMRRELDVEYTKLHLPVCQYAWSLRRTRQITVIVHYVDDITYCPGLDNAILLPYVAAAGWSQRDSHSPAFRFVYQYLCLMMRQWTVYELDVIFECLTADPASTCLCPCLSCPPNTRQHYGQMSVEDGVCVSAQGHNRP